jgi:hypothetical protein
VIRRLLLGLAFRASRGLPAEWAEAARAEAEHIGSTRELARWTLGLARLRLRGPGAWVLAAGVAAGVGLLDRYSESGLTSMAMLAGGAAATGAATRRPLVSGLVVGSGIAVTQLVAGDVAHRLALFVLVLPALAAAAVGAQARRRA